MHRKDKLIFVSKDPGSCNPFKEAFATWVVALFACNVELFLVLKAEVENVGFVEEEEGANVEEEANYVEDQRMIDSGGLRLFFVIVFLKTFDFHYVSEGLSVANDSLPQQHFFRKKLSCP